MSNAEFSAESPENYEQKTICCFVLDVSTSMDGEPIQELNRGLKEFYQDISSNSVTANRLEIAVVKFSSTIETVVSPSLVDSFGMPTLSTEGSTKLVDGVRDAIILVESRKAWYKQTGQPFLRPWIILITDGKPDKEQDIDSLANEIHLKTSEDSQNGKKFMFLAIGVKNADMQMLKKISNPSMPPAKLQGLKFSEFFQWLSASMSTVAGSKEGDKVNFPSPEDWMTGFSIS